MGVVRAYMEKHRHAFSILKSLLCVDHPKEEARSPIVPYCNNCKNAQENQKTGQAGGVGGKTKIVPKHPQEKLRGKK